MLVVGVVLGFGLGVFLLGAREMTDQSFHSIHDLQGALDLPVLGAIPVITLPSELAKARARLRRFAITGVTVLALAAGGSLLVYVFNNVAEDASAWFKREPAPESPAPPHV